MMMTTMMMIPITVKKNVAVAMHTSFTLPTVPKKARKLYDPKEQLSFGSGNSCSSFSDNGLKF